MPDPEVSVKGPEATPAAGATPVGVTPDPSEKMVPERDLLAVKKGGEKQLSDLKATMDAMKAESDRALGEKHAELLKAQAEIEQAKTATDTVPLTKYSALEAEANEGKAALEKAHEQILTGRRKELVVEYKLKPEDLEGKTGQQLDALEEAFKITGGARNTNSFDTGSGGSGQPLIGRAVELNEIAEAKTRSQVGPKINAA